MTTLAIILAALCAFFLGRIWEPLRHDFRDLPSAWRDEPDENLRPWFRAVRRLLGGGPKGGAR